MSTSAISSSLGLLVSPDQAYVSSGTASLKTENSMRSSPERVDAAAIPKPKQSKSRNGCVTCKAKRLKCDEVKPICDQCRKRGVQCGGYKKDFKWRPFEESALGGKTPKSLRKSHSNGVAKSKKSPPPPMSNTAFSDASFTTSTGGLQRSPLESCHGTLSSSLCQMQLPSPQKLSSSFEDNSAYMSLQISSDQMSHSRSYPYTNLFQFGTGFPAFSSSRLFPTFMDNGGTLGPDSIQIPDPVHGLLNFSQRSSELIYQPNPQNISSPTVVEDEVNYDGIEEIIRRNPNVRESWASSSSSASTHSSNSQSSHEETFTSACDIFARPTFNIHSPEMLFTYFDKNTCGIMSVKDGPTENPWRTLIWPLASNSPALYHAIASMTAFHMSRDKQSLRVDGIEHMRRSVTYLAQDVLDPHMRNDAALATTLVLAFSEAFDSHTSNGTKHLLGAKALVNQALTKHQTSESTPEGRKMFTFLYNVWVYLDVLARLTSEDDGDETPISHGPLAHTHQVDPLLGCSATLFPLIGLVASLVQKVRKARKNSSNIINQATNIKALLDKWAPESYYEAPEDPSLEVAHCISTAEAYRWATLLYLHQAVPELPSPSAHALAEKVMSFLARIPMASGSCIVHIYPLLAAGCEAVGKDERDWVNKRWQSMCERLWIGNVDKAWEVVKDVWERRDRFDLEQRSRMDSPSYGSPSFEVPEKFDTEETQAGGFYDWNFDSFSDNNAMGPRRQGMTNRSSGWSFREGQREYEVTVRGKLHWISVMKDRNWEVLLG